LPKFLANKLKILTENTNSYVKDSTHFINKINNLKVENRDIILSFDIGLLYTMILINKEMVVIEQVIDPEMAKLVEVCLCKCVEPAHNRSS
jgi:hypothetical protein